LYPGGWWPEKGKKDPSLLPEGVEKKKGGEEKKKKRETGRASDPAPFKKGKKERKERGGGRSTLQGWRRKGGKKTSSLQFLKGITGGIKKGREENKKKKT